MRVYLVYEYDPLEIQIGVLAVFFDENLAYSLANKESCYRQVREIETSDEITHPQVCHSDIIEI